MPSKSQRAASRQAKLRGKKKRGRGTQVFDAGPSEEDVAARRAAVIENEHHGIMSSGEVITQTSHRSTKFVRDEVEPTYTYLGAELRRIAVAFLVIFVILGVATFFLGG